MITADDVAKAKADFLRRIELAHIHYAKRMYDLTSRHKSAVEIIRGEWRDYVATLGIKQDDGEEL